MRIKLKIITEVLTVVLILVSMTTVANASLPVFFEFGTWTGDGSISVKINGNLNKFIGLSLDGKDVDSSNYTITDASPEIVITLKEEYLKTMKNSEYSFYAKFTVIDSKPFGFNTVNIDETGEVIFWETIPGFKQNVVKLICGETEVDSSNYIINDTDDGITFKKEYLDTLSGNESFTAYLTYEGASILKLNIDVPAATEASTSEESSPETTTSPVNSPSSPQTGDRGNIVILSAVILAAGAAVMLIVIRRKSNNI